MARVGIALGSNLGDRLANLRAARGLLLSLATSPATWLQAAVYQTAPVGCPPGSPDFLNTVAELETALEPLDLLAQARRIEAALGRVSGMTRNAPRTLDVDLLYHGSAILAAPELTLPHPRLRVRRFVLQPLADIRPGLVLPGQTATVAELLANLPDDGEAPKLVAATW
jgi:2-amino-4-hydroxy-6-hydroxymethyldihydropteridine diphosphokinase